MSTSKSNTFSGLLNRSTFIFGIHLCVVFFCRLLCSLALNSQFLRKLWLIITTKEQRTIFGSPASYVNMISRGIELQPNDVQEIVPLLTSFCSLLMLLITTLHDNEFYNDDSGKSIYDLFIVWRVSHFYW